MKHGVNDYLAHPDEMPWYSPWQTDGQNSPTTLSYLKLVNAGICGTLTCNHQVDTLERVTVRTVHSKVQLVAWYHHLHVVDARKRPWQQ
jgi:predicted SPOUT superfamily RNA methylase MTH1